jgi:hypothetical protein
MASCDQRDQHVNTQINVNVQGSQSADPFSLLNQGIQLLEVKSYQQSINLLNDAIKADSSIAYGYYYLALALLKGRRPKILICSEVEEIDQLLVTATTTGDSDSTIQWFRALVRDDYYKGNRMKCPPPSVEEILTSIRPNETDIDRLRALLARLPMTDNQLYIQLIKQIL